MSVRISEITRRDILDAIIVEEIDLYGRLEEIDFLARIWDLQSIPSTDSRFKDAHGDIWQHTINNDDWDRNWVFSDPRFGLMRGDDEVFLRFLCETVHPVVRTDTTQSERLVQLYNNCLKHDGFQVVEKTRLSGKPIYIGRFFGTSKTPGIHAATETLAGADVGYVAQQITRMETAVNDDPELAIGTAKELVETCCKSILSECGATAPKATDLPKLVKATVQQLELTPDSIPDNAKASATIKRLLSNLATITSGVAELRNNYGTGHGRNRATKGLQPRHAKLAVGAASTLAVFLADTHRERGETRNAH